MMDDIWEAFRTEILGIGETFKELREDSYDLTSPKKITEDLEKIDKVLTIALQGLMSLNLQYHDGQNILTEPYNHPVAAALDVSRDMLRKPDLLYYPTALIDSLIELRDTAKHAAKRTKPLRGNSKGRNSQSARKFNLGKNFVFRYRRRFGCMPPISKSGKVVALFEAMLDAAGESFDGADDVLRRAIENDAVGRQLLPSAQDAEKKRRLK